VGDHTELVLCVFPEDNNNSSTPFCFLALRRRFNFISVWNNSNLKKLT
jgi:hypothetical protein